MRIIDGDTVRQLISMPQVIKIIGELFLSVGRKETVLPHRTMVETSDGDDAVLFMPAYLPKQDSLGVKVISIFPSNKERGIPTIHGALMLISAKTGEIIAVMDAAAITAMRTGAVSAVAADVLAIKSANRLGVFGAGIQARAQIDAIRQIRPIKEVTIYDPNMVVAKALAEELDTEECTFATASSPSDLVGWAHIIITATTATSPIFDGADLMPGTHISAIGAYKPEDREVDDATMTRSNVFVDAYDAAPTEAGEIIIPLNNGTITMADIKADLGELLLRQKQGRTSPEQITFFKSVGMAVQDMAVAKHVFDQAEAANLGTVVNL